MSLRRRLLIYLLICAPLVWGLALVWSARSARQEVNEMFDTELVRLARQVQSITAPLGVEPAEPSRSQVPQASVDLDDPKDCLARFRANRLAGLVVLAAILAGGLALHD